VLDAIARALQLDDERTHLFDLAHAADGISAILRPRRRTTKRWSPRPSLQWALDAITNGPAIVRNGRMDLLAANHLGQAMHSSLTLVLALVLAFTTSLPVAVIALVVVGGPAGVGSSMLYADLRHSGAKPADIVNTRAIVSVAWIAGPPLPTLIIGAFGNRAILLAIGAIAVLVIATTAVMISQRSAAPAHAGAAEVAEEDHLALRTRVLGQRATIELGQRSRPFARPQVKIKMVKICIAR
jgi:MmyB-like transcription regulator ligand binding domain